MRVVFAGPTIFGADLPADDGYELCPPAMQGDFVRAIERGANVIGLIDGVYEYVPAIWHKEILYGLSLGVRIFGAASMGALRAAECAAFGMTGIGAIFEAYVSGELEDDADVAQSHAPAEMRFLPTSEPLVNVRATIGKCAALSLITDGEQQALLTTAETIFFKDRTYRHLVRDSIKDTARASVVLGALKDNATNVKLADAKLLINAVVETSDMRIAPKFSWTFRPTTFWNTTFGHSS
jgi:hypothetical protein